MAVAQNSLALIVIGIVGGFLKAEAAGASFDWSSVTQLLSADQRNSLPEQSVKIGESFELAGDLALLVPVEDRRKKQVALWLVLILGVFMLGCFSWKLLRKMASTEL
jgi:H+/Cl- antiporter ClcA